MDWHHGLGVSEHSQLGQTDNSAQEESVDHPEKVYHTTMKRTQVLDTIATVHVPITDQCRKSSKHRLQHYLDTHIMYTEVTNTIFMQNPHSLSRRMYMYVRKSFTSMNELLV